ncbi:MAG: hypothetical protein E7109_05095 [Bacteroidales bacterium]|jgi:predicted  nucleic acid-binding Zn-ribbon protein|nr:hypothetical protein [Bacteroidales bacterium]
MKKFLNFAVLGIIAGSLAVVSCTQEVKTSDFESLKTEVENLKNQLKASEVDLKTQLNTLQFVLQSYKDEVNPQLAQLSEDLKADYDILAAADVILAQQLEEAQNTLQAAIDENSKDIAANKKALQDAIAEYKKLVADAVKDFQAALAKAQEDQAGVDEAQDVAMLALASQLETYKEAIDEAIGVLDETVEEMAAAIVDLDEDVDKLKDAVEALDKKIDASYAAAIAYTDALEATVKATTDALAKRIEANEAAIKKLNEETIPEIEEAILALQTSVKDLEGNVEALDNKKLDADVFMDFITEYYNWQGDIEDGIAGINKSIQELTEFDVIIAKQIKAAEDAIAVLNGDETVEGSVKQQIEALHQDVIKSLTELKTEIGEQITALEAELAKVNKEIKAIQADIVLVKGEIDNLNKELIEINGKISTAEGNIVELQKAKEDHEKKIADLEKALEDMENELKGMISDLSAKIDIIRGDADTEGSIKHAVAQLSKAVNDQIDVLTGRVSKNEQDIADLQEEIGKLQKRIQSLVFVPEYQDLKFGIPFTKVGANYKAFNSQKGFPVVYKVSPVELASPIAKAINDAIAAGTTPVFTFDIISGLKTRAGENDPKLIIKEAVGDEGTGKITLYLNHLNFEPTVEGGIGNLNEYAISLRADNDEFKVHVASDYVQAKLHEMATLTVIGDALYKADASTGKVDPASKKTIDADPATAEERLALCYTDGEAYSLFDGYEMAAQEGTGGAIRTFSQFKAMGYDMPTMTTTVTKKTAGTETANIVANLTEKPVTFATKIKDGDKDNMVKTKKSITTTPFATTDTKVDWYEYKFSDGSTTLTAQVLVGIKKHTGTFQVNIPFTMTWNYALDADVDNANRDKEPSAFTKEYLREYKAGTPETNTFVVTPTMTVDGQDLVLDGSNKVFGLTVDDFMGKEFSTTWAAPTGITYNFTVDKVDASEGKNTLSLRLFQIANARLGKTYACTGTYNQNAYTDENIKAAVTIKTVDRKTDVIKITAPATNVKILGEKYTAGGDGKYNIESGDFAQAFVDAYIAQGIFPADYTKALAFATNAEFGDSGRLFIVDDTATDLDNKFTYAVVYTNPNEAFKITSNGDQLTSTVLHQVATGSDCEEKPWTLTVESYVGQRVQITWPISVAPKYDYKFDTWNLNTADNSFKVPIDWEGGSTSQITKAKVELDMITDNANNIKVMYKEGNSAYSAIPYAQYGNANYMLVPKFSLVEASTDIKVSKSTVATALDCVSNVEYYGQTPSVAVKSALYIKSGNQLFLVPGSDKMYVEGTSTAITSVNVKQSNPIAAVQPAVTETTTITSGAATLVMLTMKDVQGFNLYANGVSQSGQTPYKGTIKEIFGDVIFSIYSVNGSTSTTGWALENTDTPANVQLKTDSSVAKGTFTVVLKAKTTWKDYYYTVTVINQ